jgi:hypothetical protein
VAGVVSAPPSVSFAPITGWVEEGGSGPVPSSGGKPLADTGRPLPEILAALVEDMKSMRGLRQSSPFAGALSRG